MYPTTGATTNFQSSLGVLLLLRQSPPVTEPVEVTIERCFQNLTDHLTDGMTGMMLTCFHVP